MLIKNVTDSSPFWALTVLLVVVFFTGGSSWASEPQLMLLRPVALIAAALAAITLKPRDLMRHKVAAALLLAAVLLTALHLVPLPFEMWSSLPGRDLLAAIDQTMGLGPMARPLTMSPDATLNALYALSIPAAVLLLAVQLNAAGHRKMLFVLLGLALLSALFGLLQAAGSDITFYPLQTKSSGLFANRNHQAALLALILPLIAAVALVGPGGKPSLPWRATSAVAIGCLVVPLGIVTGSRTGLVLLAVGLMFAALIWAWRRPVQGWKARSLTPIALASLAVGLVVITSLASRDVALGRLSQNGEDLRWPVWRSVIDMLPDYMPWGTGIGSYAEAYQVLEPEALLRPTFSNHAHNEFLEIALTAGVPGLVLLALAGFALVAGLARAFSADGAASSLSATLRRSGLAIIVVLAIASATDYPARTPAMSAILALAAVWATFTTKPEQESRQGRLRAR